MGLSKKFLEAKGGKLLLLAGTDRLDKELMIGQMQGTFILPNSRIDEDGKRLKSFPPSFLNSSREIPAPSLSRRGPLHPRRPSRKDRTGPRGFLPTKRPERAGPTTESGRPPTKELRSLPQNILCKNIFPVTNHERISSRDQILTFSRVNDSHICPYIPFSLHLNIQ